MYDALGLCAPSKAHEMVDRGDNTVRRMKLDSVCGV